MDQRKALFRAKLRETKEKQGRRIDPSIVRYNEYDQPICIVCNITLKSEALWPAHQISRKHHEEIAQATKNCRSDGKCVHSSVYCARVKRLSIARKLYGTSCFGKKKRLGTGSEGRFVRREVANVQPKTKEASTNKLSLRLDQMPKKGSQATTNVKGILPGNFFDYTEDDEDEAPAPKELNRTAGNIASSNLMQVKGVPEGFFDSNKNGNSMHPGEPSPSPQAAKSSETAQVKGALPEGFFDNKDADLRARGFQPPKVDIKR